MHIKSAFIALVPLEAVLFDIDGTLCDSDPIHFVVFRELLQGIGFNGGIPIDEDFFAQNISGKLDDDIATVLFPDDIERGLDYVKKKKNVLGSVQHLPIQKLPNNLSMFQKTILSFVTCEDPVSGIKTGVAAGMPVIGLTTRNPKHMLMKANSTSPSYG
ncbi:putative HAD-like superfamily protein [Helianthus annuus]|nr:putative HAD-like superfamily protein [Helianthus annuus]